MFGAFGAGVSLAIAASLALLVVSSVVAFRGWPDDETAPRNPDVAQLSATRAEAKRAAATEIVSLPKAAVHRAPRATTRHATPHVAATKTPSQAATTADSTSAAAQAATGATSPTHETSSLSSKSKPAGDVVRDTTKAVADTVAPVAPSVAGALESVGAAGATTVDKVGQVADGVVGSVLP